MKHGFEQKQKYDFELHVQTLRSIRMLAFTNVRMQTKKIKRPESLWGLPLDKKQEFKSLSKEEIKRINYLDKKWQKSIPQKEKKTKEEILKTN